MPQTILLNRFSVFSEMNSEQKTTAIGRKNAEVKREKRQADIAASLEKGHCFSLSINYVAHHHFGNRRWWKSLLHTIATWDGNQKTLNTPVFLTDASFDNTEINGRLLGKLINRAMNYVLPLQSSEKLSLIPEHIGQENMLAADAISVAECQDKKSYFEYLHNGKIYSIMQNRKAAGYLPKQLLLDIFSEENLKNCLILIYSDDHAIGLAFITGSTWLIYDPNYDHTNPDAMEKTGTIEQSLDEAIRILGNALTFEFASFDANPVLTLSAYEEAMKADFSVLLSHGGLFHCAKYLPNELIACLEEAYHSPETRDRVIERIKNLFTTKWNDSNGLISILRRDERVLLLLLKIGKESVHYDEMRLNLMTALAAQDAKESMVLVYLIKHTESLIPVLDFLVTDKASLVFVMNLFAMNQKDGVPIWSLLNAEESEQLVNFVLSKMTDNDFDFYGQIPSSENNSPFPEILLAFMRFKFANNIGETVFEIVLKKTPEVLPVIAQLVLGIPDGLDLLTDFFYSRLSFSSQDNWQMLSNRPVEKQAIMQSLVQHIHQMDLETLTKNYQKICVKEGGVSGWLNRSGQKSSGFSVFLRKEIARELESYKLDSHMTKKRKCSASR